MHRIGSLLLAIIFCFGCTRITTTETLVDLERQRSFRPAPDHSEIDLNGACAAAESGEVKCSFIYETTLMEMEMEYLRQRKDVKKRASLPVQIFYYLGGASALTFGTVLTADAHNVPDENDRTTTNPFPRSAVYGIGAGTLALGATLIILGAVGSARAKDTQEVLEPQNTVVGSREVAGDKGAWAQKTVSVYAGQTVLIQGRTDAAGAFNFDLQELFAKSTLLQEGKVASLSVVLEGAKDATVVPITSYRYYSCGVSAQSIVGRSPDEYRVYFKQCPARVQWLASSPVWLKLAERYAKQVTDLCESPESREYFDACESHYKRLMEHIPANMVPSDAYQRFSEARAKFMEKYNFKMAEERFASAKEAFKDEEWDAAVRYCEECLSLAPDMEACKKLKGKVEKRAHKAPQTQSNQ